MAKTRDEDLYRSLRSKGLRKSVARTVAEAAGTARQGGRKAPDALRSAAKELQSVVADLEDRAKGGPAKRKASAQKAARTRKQSAAQRSAAARKAARTRARSSSQRSASARKGATTRARSGAQRSASARKGATTRTRAR